MYKNISKTNKQCFFITILESSPNAVNIIDYEIYFVETHM